MSEKKVIKIGDIVKIFLSNNYTYEGNVIAVDDNLIKILDYKSNQEKVFPFLSITNIDVKNNKESESNEKRD